MAVEVPPHLTALSDALISGRVEDAIDRCVVAWVPSEKRHHSDVSRHFSSPAPTITHTSTRHP
jgi:hypothetical protein